MILVPAGNMVKGQKELYGVHTLLELLFFIIPSFFGCPERCGWVGRVRPGRDFLELSYDIMRNLVAMARYHKGKVQYSGFLTLLEIGLAIPPHWLKARG